MLKKFRFVFTLMLYGCAALQFTRFYLKSTVSYLNLPAYLAGQERLPFQERVFPLLILKPLAHLSAIQHLQKDQQSAMGQQWPAYMLSLVALLVLAGFTQALYERITRHGLLRPLLFPVLLFALLWTFTIHLEANFYYPYDLPGVAFFTAGLYFIVTQRYPSLLIVVLVGTTNRETTLFLPLLYVVDAFSRQAKGLTGRLSATVRMRRVPWARAALLLLVWAMVRAVLIHRFAANSHAESFLRVSDNLHQLRPRLMPALLNLCGYLLPLVVLFARGLRPVYFRNYLWALPAWIAVMFGAGVLVETRIYGEWCGYAAVATVLILERTAERRIRGIVSRTTSVSGARRFRDLPARQQSLPARDEAA